MLSPIISLYPLSLSGPKKKRQTKKERRKRETERRQERERHSRGAWKELSLADSMAEGLSCTSDPRNGFSVPASSDGSLFQRRIEFHPGRKAFTGFSNGSGDFFLEALNPSLGSQNPASNVGTSSSTGKKSEDGDVFEHGLDPELSFGITFRRIVSWFFFLRQLNGFSL